MSLSNKIPTEVISACHAAAYKILSANPRITDQFGSDPSNYLIISAIPYKSRFFIHFFGSPIPLTAQSFTLLTILAFAKCFPVYGIKSNTIPDAPFVRSYQLTPHDAHKYIYRLHKEMITALHYDKIALAIADNTGRYILSVPAAHILFDPLTIRMAPDHRLTDLADILHFHMKRHIDDQPLLA